MIRHLSFKGDFNMDDNTLHYDHKIDETADIIHRFDKIQPYFIADCAILIANEIKFEVSAENGIPLIKIKFNE